MLKNQKIDAELVNVVIAGSVDDGKSTLIGRLFYDGGQIYKDQIAEMEKFEKINGEIDYSLFTDGLAAEREQKITIDVAYRYFSTQKRRFVFADVPGHDQYTKNMVTGASKAHVAIILIDITSGVSPQSRRHLTLCNLLGIKHIAVAINKIDRADYSEDSFNKIKEEFNKFSSQLYINDIEFIPCSAVKGDMVVERGNKMPWYKGKTILQYLENAPSDYDNNLNNLRLPVQYVSKYNDTQRVYMGLVESGTIQIGDEIKILPHGNKAIISSIYLGKDNLGQAIAGQSISFMVDRQTDISRGDIITHQSSTQQPKINTELQAMIFWMGDKTDLEARKIYLLKHTSKIVRCFVQKINYKLNIDTMSIEQTDKLVDKEIARVHLITNEPLIFDDYNQNRDTGSFIIIDEITYETVGVGIIVEKENDEKINSEKNNEKKPGNIFFVDNAENDHDKNTLLMEITNFLNNQNISYELFDEKKLKQLNYLKDQDKIAVIKMITEILNKNGVTILINLKKIEQDFIKNFNGAKKLTADMTTEQIKKIITQKLFD